MRRLALPAALVLLAGCGSTTTRTVTATTPVSSTTGTTTSVTAASTTQPTMPVYFQGAVGTPAMRPRALELTADGTLSVERVQWTAWGGPRASGSGNALYHGCTPNCAAAPTHTAVVAIRLSEVRTCGGRRYYAGVTLRLASGRLLDQSFLQRSWAPC